MSLIPNSRSARALCSALLPSPGHPWKGTTGQEGSDSALPRRQTSIRSPSSTSSVLGAGVPKRCRDKLQSPV